MSSAPFGAARVCTDDTIWRVTLEPVRIQDFRMVGSIGVGSTARVFDAVHIATGRTVAVKMLEPSANGTEIRERFAREAIALAGITSKYVGRILAYGFERGQPFLVLEKLQGETLDAKYRRDGPLPMPLALEWIAQLICAVRDIHAANIVHRDIKPGNIFLDTSGGETTVKLIDFGVARVMEMSGEQLTSTNHLIGSMGYMAPEQFVQAKSVGFPADIYAVGVVIYRVLTGKLPFSSKSLETLIRMKCDQTPPALSTMPNAPRFDVLDWFVSVCLSKNPTQRFQTAREALDAWFKVRNSVHASWEDDSETMLDALSGSGIAPSSTLVETDRIVRESGTQASTSRETDESPVTRRVDPNQPAVELEGSGATQKMAAYRPPVVPLASERKVSSRPHSGASTSRGAELPATPGVKPTIRKRVRP